MAVDSGPFPQSALDANKNGRLTDEQRKLVRAASRGVRKSELTVAVFAAALGVFLFFAVKPSSPVLVRVVIPIGCLVLAAVLLLRAITGEDSVTRDLRHPDVESLEGPISKHMVSTGSHNAPPNYYLTVAGQRFAVGTHAYHAAPEAGFVRIYFLPSSRHVVNLERLPDRSLPEGTTPQGVMQQFAQAMRSHDRAWIDEVRAEMTGTQNAMMAGISHDASPPPEESRDQRPLGEAIQGTWSDGPIKAVFSADGTLSITMMGANERSGHWSVDGDGKLVTDLVGQDRATDAWIVGDRLTVSLGGQAITLKRESA